MFLLFFGLALSLALSSITLVYSRCKHTTKLYFAIKHIWGKNETKKSKSIFFLSLSIFKDLGAVPFNYLCYERAYLTFRPCWVPSSTSLMPRAAQVWMSLTLGCTHRKSLISLWFLIFLLSLTAHSDLEFPQIFILVSFQILPIYT